MKLSENNLEQALKLLENQVFDFEPEYAAEWLLTNMQNTEYNIRLSDEGVLIARKESGFFSSKSQTFVLFCTDDELLTEIEG